jgi:threonyl-tRNA synthetase
MALPDRQRVVRLAVAVDDHERDLLELGFADSLANGVVALVDLAEPTETIGKRIRESELEKIPFVVVYGDRESDESLAIRERGGGQSQQSLAEFLGNLARLAS